MGLWFYISQNLSYISFSPFTHCLKRLRDCDFNPATTGKCLGFLLSYFYFGELWHHNPCKTMMQLLKDPPLVEEISKVELPKCHMSAPIHIQSYFCIITIDIGPRKVYIGYFIHFENLGMEYTFSASSNLFAYYLCVRLAHSRNYRCSFTHCNVNPLWADKSGKSMKSHAFLEPQNQHLDLKLLNPVYG